MVYTDVDWGTVELGLLRGTFWWSSGVPGVCGGTPTHAHPVRLPGGGCGWQKGQVWGLASIPLSVSVPLSPSLYMEYTSKSWVAMIHSRQMVKILPKQIFKCKEGRFYILNIYVFC